MMGLEVELPYADRKFKVRLENDRLVYEVHTETWENGKFTDSGKMQSCLDLTLWCFMRACKDMSARELVELSADVALNRLKGK